jgi:monoamine oxidase
VLVGWTGGPSAEKLAGMSPQLVFEQAVKSLAKFFGCSGEAMSRAIVDWRMHDWTADPLTRGAYSYSVAAMENLPQQMARPVNRTLFFAGEALADALELGTVHGALSSGERAAGEILGVLRKKD